MCKAGKKTRVHVTNALPQLRTSVTEYVIFQITFEIIQGQTRSNQLPQFNHVKYESWGPVFYFKKAIKNVTNTKRQTRTANLMQQDNFIDVFLARHGSGTYAHHQEH